MGPSIDDQIADLLARGIEPTVLHRIKAQFCANGRKDVYRERLHAAGFEDLRFQDSDGWNNIPADFEVTGYRYQPATKEALTKLIRELETDFAGQFVNVVINPTGMTSPPPYHLHIAQTTVVGANEIKHSMYFDVSSGLLVPSSGSITQFISPSEAKLDREVSYADTQDSREATLKRSLFIDNGWSPGACHTGWAYFDVTLMVPHDADFDETRFVVRRNGEVVHDVSPHGTYGSNRWNIIRSWEAHSGAETIFGTLLVSLEQRGKLLAEFLFETEKIPGSDEADRRFFAWFNTPYDPSAPPPGSRLEASGSTLAATS